MPGEIPSTASIDPALLDRYLSGTCSKDEVRQVSHWLVGDPSRRAFTEAVPLMPGDPSLPLVTTDIDLEWNALSARLDAEAGSVKPPRYPKPRVGRSRRTIGIMAGTGTMAALLVLLALGTPSWNHATHRPIVQQYVTQRAQQSTFELPDGSQVVLAPETRVKYTSDDQGRRTVDLEGQAYFTVTHDPDRLFRVLTRGVETRVLGTAFAVRAYRTDPTIQMAVSAGKIAVETGGPGIVLLPGDVVHARPGEKPHIMHDVTIAAVVGWMRGQLHFDDIPLSDVVTELERYYDLNITITDASLARQPVTITIGGESATTMLESIEFALDVKCRRKGNIVVISSH